MSIPSANQGIPEQQGADPANLPAAQVAWDAVMENRLVQRYASIADRTARNAAPNEGELSHLADVDRIEVFDSANWISAFRRSHWGYVRKSADQTVNNSTVLVNDTELFVPMPTAGTFAWEAVLFSSSSDVADIKYALTWPAGVTAMWGTMGLATTAVAGVGDVAIDTETTSGNVNFHGGGTSQMVVFYGDLTMGGTAGNLQIQFAQNTAEVSNTIVRSRSRLRVWRTA
jgi:hypothetical protein